MPVLHGSMLENSVNQIHGNCNLRQNIQHKLADLSMYCVKRIYAIQAASSERKCTWGFKMNVFMAVLLFFDSTVTLPQQIHLNTSLVTATDWSINWLSWVLCPTGHKIGHFGDVLISQSQYSAEINKWVWAHYSTGDCELNRLLILATLSIGLHLRGYVSFKAHTTVLTTKFLWCQSSCVERLAIISRRTHTYTHTRLTALCPGQPTSAGTRKVKPIWILLKTVSGSGISWAICKSAPSSRQITMPAPHHSVFYRPDALPSFQPTASKHWGTHLSRGPEL